MGKFRGLDSDEGWINRKFAELDRRLREMSAERRINTVVSDFAQADQDAFNLTGAWATYLTRTITVPATYTHAIVQMSVSAGFMVGGSVLGSDNGILGVQPVVAGIGGPALSTGKTGGGAVSINSSQSIKVPVTGTLSLSLKAYASATTVVNNTGNVHLSATVLFVTEKST